MKYEIFSRARKALIISLVTWLFNRYRMAIEQPVIPQLCVIVRDSLRNDEQIICQRLAKGKRDEERERERETGREEGQQLLGGGISRNHVADNGLYVIVPRESMPLTSFELLTFHPLNSSCLWSVAPSATGFNRQRWLSRDAKLPIKVVIKFNGSKGIGDYAIQGTSKP